MSIDKATIEMLADNLRGIETISLHVVATFAVLVWVFRVFVRDVMDLGSTVRNARRLRNAHRTQRHGGNDNA